MTTVIAGYIVARRLRSYQLARAADTADATAATAGRTPTQTGHRTHLSGGRADSVHTATPETTKQSCVSCLAWIGLLLSTCSDFKSDTHTTFLLLLHCQTDNLLNRLILVSFYSAMTTELVLAELIRCDCECVFCNSLYFMFLHFILYCGQL